MYQPWKNLELWPIQRAEKILTQFVTIGSSLVYLMWKIMVVTRRCLQTPLGKIHIPFPSFFFFFLGEYYGQGNWRRLFTTETMLWKGKTSEKYCLEMVQKERGTAYTNSEMNGFCVFLCF